MTKSIEEIERILSQGFNLGMFYDRNHFNLDVDDMRIMIYHTLYYKELNTLTHDDLYKFYDHVCTKKEEGAQNESI